MTEKYDYENRQGVTSVTGEGDQVRQMGQNCSHMIYNCPYLQEGYGDVASWI